MKKFLRLIILLLLIFPVSTKAYYNSCSVSDTVKLNKVASNVLSNYTYYIDGAGNLKFKIIINNLHSYLYLYDTQTKQTYYSTGEISIMNYGPGANLKFELRSNLGYCKGVYVSSIYVTLPYYNKYYSDELCKGIENYKLCKRWTKVNLSYEEFKNEITKYRNSLKKPDAIVDDYNKSILEIILDFYFDYYYVILPPIVIMGGIIIYMVKRKREKENFF